MPTDLREQLTRAAGQPTHGPDVEEAMRRGGWLRLRRRVGISLTAVVAALAVVGTATGAWERVRPSEMPPIGDVETEASLQAPVVHDAWIEVNELTSHREGDDGSQDEAPSDQHVWDEQEQAWVGPQQSLKLDVAVPEGADAVLVEDTDGLLLATLMPFGSGAWVIEVPLEVYDDQTEQTADQLEVVLRAVSTDGKARTDGTPMPEWPNVTATSEPIHVSDVRADP